MRAALNILFGCLLLTMQAMATLAPHTVSQTDTCHCCACGSPCSVPQTAPAPLSIPLAAQRTSVEAESIVTRVSVTASAESSPANDCFLIPQFPDSPPTAGFPLYRRHCALLI